ncbi:MAG: nucleotide pyrophosphohydrolase [Candidatus Paceibacteria bacterium]
MEFHEIQKRAIEVREKYAKLEKHKGAKEWTREDLVRGFVGDVGDLVKLTMSEDELRTIKNSKEKLAHELADCLWSIIVIADKYDVDLKESFLKTMDELEKKIESDLKK